MRTKTFLAGTILAGATLLGSHANAALIPIVWNFDSPTGNLGTSHTYNYTPAVGPAMSIAATGYNCTNATCSTAATVDLFGKNQGAGEQGLGLINDPNGQDEITHGNFVQLDLTNLKQVNLVQTSLSFDANSVQSGSNDEWQVFGTNTAGELSGATLLDSGTTDAPVAQLPNFSIGQYRYLDVSAASGNVLLQELDNEILTGNVSLNEPETLAVLGAGLIGVWLLRSRRRDQSDEDDRPMAATAI